MSNEALEKRLAEENDELHGQLSHITKFDIVDQKSLDIALLGVKEAKAQWKNYEDERKKVTVPMNQALRAVNDMFRPVQTTLKEMEKAWKNKVNTYRDELERQSEQARRDAARAAKEGDMEAVHSAAMTASEVEADFGKTYFVERWTYEIENDNLIPREFLMPDERAIVAHVKAHKDKAKIKGVKVFSVKEARSRG